MRTLARLSLVVLAISCASRKPAPAPLVPPPIRSIAVVAGDVLSSDLSTELVNRRFKIYEVPATQDLTARALQSLAARGVDAVLVARTTRGLDMLPDVASVRLLRSINGETVTTFDWPNPSRMKIPEVAAAVVRRLTETVPSP